LSDIEIFCSSHELDTMRIGMFIESFYLTVAGCHFLPGCVLPNGLVMAGSDEQ
jgi:hypothetical protein